MDQWTGGESEENRLAFGALTGQPPSAGGQLYESSCNRVRTRACRSSVGAIQPPASRLVGYFLLLAAVFSVITGCSSPKICAGASAQPPYVALSTKAWVASHPTAELRACIDQNCTSLQNSEVQVSDGLNSDDGSEAHTVTITATDAGRQTLAVTGRFRLQMTTLESACGDRQSFSTTIILNSSGHLVIPAAAAIK